MAPTFRQATIHLALLSSALIGISSAARAIHVEEALKARQAVAFWGGEFITLRLMADADSRTKQVSLSHIAVPHVPAIPMNA